jgi:peptidoglycan/xylan/chitin deacetylase (PgdA/CDA1 family)
MLNFRNTNIFFSILLIVLIGIHIKYDLPVYIYPLLFIVYSLILFYGCYYIRSNFFIKVICSANTDQKEIAISFDDGPSSHYTTEILQLLKQDNIKATFFCIGNRITGNERIITKIKEEGHIIGNHSYSHHFWFDIFSSKKMLDDLKKMDQETERVIGILPKLFRPPYGVTNPNLKKAIIKGDYTPVGWSVRSMETIIRNEKELLDRINRSLKPGAVFLFHDTSKITVNILPEFIREVKIKGYHIIPLDKLLHLTPYA